MTAADNRGKAVSEVVLMGRKAFVKGALNDSSRIEYQLSMDRGEGDPYIGRKVCKINTKQNKDNISVRK